MNKKKGIILITVLLTTLVVSALFLGFWSLGYGFTWIINNLTLTNIYYYFSIFGVFATLGAVIVAIRIPKKIANQQDKIALFDKHSLVYDTYIKSIQILDFDVFEKYASVGFLDKISLQIIKIIEMRNEIFIQYNKAKFLCKDDPILLEKLKIIAYEYIEVSDFYINIQPKYTEILEKAWSAVHKQFPDISSLQSLMKNEQAKKIFEAHNTTPASSNLEALITKYSENFSDENFDIHFEKYLTIE